MPSPTPTDNPYATPHATAQQPTVFTQPIDRRLTLVVCASQLIILTLVSIKLVQASGPPWVPALFLTVLILSTWLFLMMRITIRLEPDHMRYAFLPFWRGKLNYNDIESVDVDRILPIVHFGGWGVKHRMGLHAGNHKAKDKSRLNIDTGLIAKAGPAIKINRANKGSLYITMDNAEQLAIAILERTAFKATDNEPDTP